MQILRNGSPHVVILVMAAGAFFCEQSFAVRRSCRSLLARASQQDCPNHYRCAKNCKLRGVPFAKKTADGRCRSLNRNEVVYFCFSTHPLANTLPCVFAPNLDTELDDNRSF